VLQKYTSYKAIKGGPNNYKPKRKHGIDDRDHIYIEHMDT
jgi:hypothetical protein